MKKIKGIKEIEKCLSVMALLTLLMLCNGCALLGTDDKGRTPSEAMLARVEFQSGMKFYPITDEKVTSGGNGGSVFSTSPETFTQTYASDECDFTVTSRCQLSERGYFLCFDNYYEAIYRKRYDEAVRPIADKYFTGEYYIWIDDMSYDLEKKVSPDNEPSMEEFKQNEGVYLTIIELDMDDETVLEVAPEFKKELERNGYKCQLYVAGNGIIENEFLREEIKNAGSDLSYVDFDWIYCNREEYKSFSAYNYTAKPIPRFIRDNYLVMEKYDDYDCIVAKKGDKYGILDYEGNILLDFEYDLIELGDRSERYLMIKKNDKVGYYFYDKREIDHWREY